MNGFTQKLREAIEVLAGFRGPRNRHAVRYGDLRPYLSAIEGAQSRLAVLVGDIRDVRGRAEQAWEQHEETLAEADRRLENVRSQLQSDYDDLRDTSDATQFRITTLEEDLGTTAATVTDILTLEIDQDSALMGRLTQLEGKADDAQASADDILSLNVSPDTALLSRFAQLEGEVDANGDDISDVKGDVSSLYSLNVTGSSAFGAWMDEIKTQFGSTRAFTRQAATAYAGIDGLSSTFVLRQRAGKATGYLEAVAADNPNGSALSTFRLSYDFIDLVGQVSATDLQTNSVRANHIQANSVRANHIQANSVNADHIQVTSLSAISADLGFIEVDFAHIKDLAVDTIKVADGAINKFVDMYRTGFSIGASTNTYASVSINPFGNYARITISIDAFFNSQVYQETKLKIRIQRYGTTIHEAYIWTFTGEDIDDLNQAFVFIDRDKPRGTQVYNIQFRTNENQITVRSLYVLAEAALK